MTQSILLLLAHPDYAKSKAGKALISAVENIPGLRVRHLDALRHNGQFSVPEETELLRAADTLVWQFPLYWYNCPSALRDWQDQVLSPIVYGPDNFLKGKSVRVAFTAGARASAYRAGDLVGFTPDEMLRPFQMTVSASGMTWLPFFGVFGVHDLTPEEMQRAAAEYRELLLGNPE